MRARMPLATLPALLLVVLLATGRQAAAEELLVNGDFSQGKAAGRPTAWTCTSTPTATGMPLTPAAGLHLSDTGEGWLVSGAVPIEPGGTYEASGYAYFAAGAGRPPELLVVLAFYQTADGAGLPSQDNVSSVSPLPADDYSLVTTGRTAPPDGPAPHACVWSSRRQDRPRPVWTI